MRSPDGAPSLEVSLASRRGDSSASPPERSRFSPACGSPAARERHLPPPRYAPFCRSRREAGSGSGLYPTVAVSPDGATVVFRASDAGVGRLYRRPLAGGEAEPIPGTEGGRGPFFSPDGEWLGFVTLAELKKVPMSGGAPSRIVELPPVSQRGDVDVGRLGRRGPLEQQRSLPDRFVRRSSRALPPARRGSRRARAPLAAGAASRPGRARHDRPRRGLPGPSERRGGGHRARHRETPRPDGGKHVRPLRASRLARLRAGRLGLRGAIRSLAPPDRGDSRRRPRALCRRRLCRHGQLRRHERRNTHLRRRGSRSGGE